MSNPDGPLQVGRSIRAHREQRGISLRTLAARLGVSAGTLSAVENDVTSPSVERLGRIAAELDVSPQALLLPPREPSAGLLAGSSAVAPVAGSDGAPMQAWREFGELEEFTTDPVLRGALAVFCLKGFHGASIREIAEAAGLSVPGLYHYHPSKLAILVALLDLTMSDLTWRMEAARAAAVDDADRLRLDVECLALFHARRPEMAFVGASEMRSLVPGPDEQRIVQSRKRIQRMLYDDIGAHLMGVPGADRRVVILGNAISTMCTSVAQWFHPQGSVTAEELARLYARSALAMCADPRIDHHLSPPTDGKATA